VFGFRRICVNFDSEWGQSYLEQRVFLIMQDQEPS